MPEEPEGIHLIVRPNGFHDGPWPPGNICKPGFNGLPRIICYSDGKFQINLELHTLVVKPNGFSYTNAAGENALLPLLPWPPRPGWPVSPFPPPNDFQPGIPSPCLPAGPGPEEPEGPEPTAARAQPMAERPEPEPARRQPPPARRRGG